jgi:hypothetical protein
VVGLVIPATKNLHNSTTTDERQCSNFHRYQSLGRRGNEPEPERSKLSFWLTHYFRAILSVTQLA